MLAVIRRGPFAEPTESEKVEYLFTRVKKDRVRSDFENYALEHVLSYQRRVAATKESFMKTLLLLLLCFCSALAAEKKPNFIVIFADDMGYGDLQCFGAPKTKTPNLNQMAAEGMKMTDFHTFDLKI